MGAMPLIPLYRCAPDADWHEYDPASGNDEADSREGSGDGDLY